MIVVVVVVVVVYFVTLFVFLDSHRNPCHLHRTLQFIVYALNSSQGVRSSTRSSYKSCSSRNKSSGTGEIRVRHACQKNDTRSSYKSCCGRDKPNGRVVKSSTTYMSGERPRMPRGCTRPKRSVHLCRSRTSLLCGLQIPDVSSVVAATSDEPSACPQSDGPLPPKAWRRPVKQPFPTIGQDKGMGVIDGDQHKRVLDVNDVRSFCQPPVLGWTAAMQV